MAAELHKKKQNHFNKYFILVNYPDKPTLLCRFLKGGFFLLRRLQGIWVLNKSLINSEFLKYLRRCKENGNELMCVSKMSAIPLVIGLS